MYLPFCWKSSIFSMVYKLKTEFKTEIKKKSFYRVSYNTPIACLDLLYSTKRLHDHFHHFDSSYVPQISYNCVYEVFDLSSFDKSDQIWSLKEFLYSPSQYIELDASYRFYLWLDSVFPFFGKLYWNFLKEEHFEIQA